MIFSVKFVLFD